MDKEKCICECPNTGYRNQAYFEAAGNGFWSDKFCKGICCDRESHGMETSFGVTCKHNSQPYYTPETVCDEAGVECVPGEKETGEPCGNCGQKVRTCGASGYWGSWSCQNEGVCVPGSVSSDGCEFGKQTKKCNASCQWDTCVCPDGYQPWAYSYGATKECMNTCYCAVGVYEGAFEPVCPVSQCERLGCYGDNPPLRYCDGGIVLGYQP